MLRLLEPPGSCPDSLWARLQGGSYDKPFVLDRGPRRLLHFDLAAVQSAMLLRSPQRLILAYTREMMTFLFYNPAPARILLLGLGGGSIAKFCHSRLPDADITAVEVSADVVSLRQEFSIPADGDRFRVIRADGADYVAGLRANVDVILADACDQSGIAARFNSMTFYRNARKCLARGGLFVSNICGDERACLDHLSKMRKAFGDHVLTLKMGRNLIAFGFRDPPPAWPARQRAVRAGELKRRFGINFPAYVAQLSSTPAR
jgi:spermidine synthase